MASGSETTARTRMRPPHVRQWVMSMAKTDRVNVTVQIFDAAKVDEQHLREEIIATRAVEDTLPRQPKHLSEASQGDDVSCAASALPSEQGRQRSALMEIGHRAGAAPCQARRGSRTAQEACWTWPQKAA